MGGISEGIWEGIVNEISEILGVMLEGILGKIPKDNPEKEFLNDSREE